MTTWIRLADSVVWHAWANPGNDADEIITFCGITAWEYAEDDREQALRAGENRCIECLDALEPEG